MRCSSLNIGIDVGGTNLRAGIVDESGRLLSQEQIPVGNFESPEAFVRKLAALTERALDTAHAAVSDIGSIGIGIPGAVKNGEILYTCNLPLTGVPLAAMLRRYFDLPIYLENDANCAAVGEWLYGSGRETQNFIMVTLGTGIGGGFILNGRLYSGSGMAGEIGHMVIEAGGFPCSCGRCGCWEAYSSAPALIRMAYAAMEKHPDSILHELSGKSGGMDGRAVFQAAEMGDSTALELCRTYGNYLAEGLTNLANLFDPEVIAIGGGISGAPEHLLLMPVREAVRQKCYTGHAGRYPQIVTAALGGQAGMIGAASLGNAI